jgi:hypothetical protein
MRDRMMDRHAPCAKGLVRCEPIDRRVTDGIGARRPAVRKQERTVVGSELTDIGFDVRAMRPVGQSAADQSAILIG